MQIARLDSTANREPSVPPDTDGPQAIDALSSSGPVARGAFALLSAQPLTWAATLAATILVPRYMGDDGLGRFAIAWTIAGFVGLFASMGLSNFLTRKVATDPARAATYAWAAVVVVAVASCVIGSAVLGLLAIFRLTAIDPALTALGILTMLVLGAQGIVMSALVGLERHARYAWSSAGASVVATAAALSALALGGGTQGYAATVLAVSVGTTTLFWATSGFRFSTSAISPEILREVVSGGLPFLWWNAALRIRANIDLVLTGVLLQPYVAGWLSAAYRIINVTVFIPTVITTPLLPVLSKNKSRPDTYRAVLRESLVAVLFLTVPVSASIFALAPSIPDLIGWPVELRQSVLPMMILAFQQVLIGVDMVLGVSLMALGRERQWLRVAIAGAVFNPVCNLIGIPLAQALVGNGAVGAAVVELATEFVFLGGALYLTPRELLARDLVSRAGRTLLCGMVLLVVASLLRPINPIVALFAGGLSYLVTAWAVGIVGRSQLRAMRVALRPA